MDAGLSVGIRSDLEATFARPPGFAEYITERYSYSHRIGSEGGVRKLLLAPLLPFVFTVRIGWMVAMKRRFVLRWLLCAPAIFFLAFVQAAGEFAGALPRPNR
jgi:hypothetical protein